MKKLTLFLLLFILLTSFSFAATIKLRGDTAANWTSEDPTLSAREVGLETDTKRFKVGDGATAWTSLAYAVPDISSTGDLTTASTTNPLAPTWTTAMHTVYYGATGEIDLPAVSGYAGKGILIYNTGEFTITIDPNGSEVIVRDGTAQTGGVSMTLSSGAGNFVAMLCDGTRWITLGYKGTLAEGS